MTLLEWLLGMILTALGAAVVTVVKADLEDAKVCHWLARQLIFLAADRLPEDDRARWREECIADLLQMEGRTAPLLWALSTWAGAGRWGRMLGAPSRWQVLIARVRARWTQLRSQRNAPAQPAPPPVKSTQVLHVGVDAVLAIRPAGIPSQAAVGTPRLEPGGMMHLSQHEYMLWLAQDRRDFEDHIDRKVEEYGRARDRELGL